MISISYIFSSLENEIDIYRNEANLIQSELYAESVINIILSDREKLYDFCKKIYNKNNVIVTLNENLYNLEEISDLDLSLKLDDSYEEDGFLLQCNLDYKGVKSSCYGKGTIVNSIYSRGANVLNSETINKTEMEKLEDELENLKSYYNNTINVIELDFETYYMEKQDDKLYIYSESFDGNGEIIKNIVYESLIVNTIFINQEEGNIVIEDEMELNGVFNFDKVFLHENLSVNGAVIINGDVEYIDVKKLLKVSGILINLKGINENNIETFYNFDILKKHSNYIPGFFDIKVRAIQKSKVKI